MTCANPACGLQSLYLRSGGIYHVDSPGAPGKAGESRSVQRKVIWLCHACTGQFSVQTWRPPGEQVQPSAGQPFQFPRARGRQQSAES